MSERGSRRPEYEVEAMPVNDCQLNAHATVGRIRCYGRHQVA